MTRPRRRAAVTGASGYVGRALVDRLLADGWHVRALVQPGTEADAPVDPAVTWVVSDISDDEAVVDCVAGVDVVHHLAGLMPSPSDPDLRPVNVYGTRVVARAAASGGAGRLVFLSSAAVYAPAPPTDWPLTEDSPLRRRRPGRNAAGLPVARFLRSMEEYGLSKAEAERIVRREHVRTGLPLCVVRSTEIYGPYRRWFARYVEAARRRPGHLLRPSARVPSMQWVHLDDLLELLVAAGNDVSRGPLVVNAAGPRAFSLLDLGQLAVPELARVPTMDGPRVKYSVDLARRRLGWRPVVPLARGMHEILAAAGSGVPR